MLPPLLSTVLGLFSTHLHTFHCFYEGVAVIVILTRTMTAKPKTLNLCLICIYPINLNVIRGFMVKHSWCYGQTFVVLWSNIRDFMVKHSWFYGQTFVVLWSSIRGFRVKHSWFYGQTFVVLWSNLRGFMVKHSWFYGQTFVALWSGLPGGPLEPPRLL